MDIEKLLALKETDLRAEDDEDIARLQRLSDVCAKHVERERATDPTAEQRTDDEIISLKQSEVIRELDDTMEQTMASYGSVFKDLSSSSIVSVLPLLLRLRGLPYTLDNHFPMEPMFKTELPIQFLLRCGRQVSKCVARGEPVITANGRAIPIEQVKHNVAALCKSWRLTSQPTLACHPNGCSPVFLLTTRLGYRARLTGNHRVKTLNGYQTVEQLHERLQRNEDVRIATPRRCGRFTGTAAADDALLTFIGLMLGDGCSAHSTLGFTAKKGSPLLALFENAATNLGQAELRYYHKLRATDIRFNRTSPLTEILREHGLLHKRAWEKKIPPFVFALTREQTITFLNALWATDGCIFSKNNGRDGNVSYTSTSPGLVADLRRLLLKFGIVSSINRHKAGYRKRDGTYQCCRDAHVLRVETSASKQIFLRTIHPPGKTSDISFTKSNNNRDTLPPEVIPRIRALFSAIVNKPQNSLRENGLRAKLKYPPTSAKLEQMLQFAESRCGVTSATRELRQLLAGDIYWDRVTAIKPDGEADTYDLEVDAEHNFIVDGIIVHNSTTLAAQGVIHAGTLGYFNSLFVTPLFEQCRRFSANYVRPFVNESPIHRHLVDNKCEQNVLQRSFRNNSKMFFSYCLKDADRVRGIAADRVTIDECVIGETLLDTPRGPARIDEIPVGSEIYSRDPRTGKVVIDQLVDKALVDICATYRVVFSDGSSIVCGAAHRFVGPTGEIRVKDLLNDDKITSADHFRNSAGRCVPMLDGDEVPALGNTAQPETERLHNSHVLQAQKFLQKRSTHRTEPRLRKRDNRTNDERAARSAARLGSRLPRGPQIREFALAGRIGLGRRCLLVHGRRHVPKKQNRSAGSAELFDTRFFATRSATTSEVDDKTRRKLQCAHHQQPKANGYAENVPHIKRLAKIARHVDSAHRALHHSGSALQNRCSSANKKSAVRMVRLRLQGQRTANLQKKSSALWEKNLRPLGPAVFKNEVRGTSGVVYITQIIPAGTQPLWDCTTSRTGTYYACGVLNHNCQDIDWDLLPIILETMSASKWAVTQAAGTPKTMDNTIEYMWDRSSQAEWVTRCTACNHWNIACLAHDLLAMIGPETICCAKCQRAINPRPAFHPDPSKRGTGLWMHSFDDRAVEFPGYHAPQIIFPMHFDNPRKWKVLRQKMDPSHTPRHLFINEVLGEGADAGTKLISQAELIHACTLYGRPNKILEAMRIKGGYLDVAIGVDWGGSTAPYGTGRAHLLLKPEEGQSYTTLAVIGLRNNGKLDVIYLYRFDLIGNHLEEARACLNMWNDVDSGNGGTLFAHDFGGAGSVRETLLIQAGMPVQNVMGCQYVHAPQQQMLEFKAKGGRNYWSLDKARSLVFLCQTIKSGFVGFPSWETCKDHLRDFLALIEDTIERPGASNITRVIRKPGVPDDIAHAINFAACALWHRHGYPNFKDILTMTALLERLDSSAEAVIEDEQS